MLKIIYPYLRYHDVAIEIHENIDMIDHKAVDKYICQSVI